MDISEQFEAHRARVYRWARALCGNHHDALDCVQEVFLRMMRDPPAAAGMPATVGWLRRVTGRVVIDRWRSAVSRASRERVVAVREAERAAEGACGDAPDQRELSERIAAALETLSEQQRMVLMARSYDGMTFQEIADELRIAVSTAKTHYLRGLAAVRDALAIELHAEKIR